MSKRIEITKKDFNSALGHFNAVHKFIDGDFTVAQHYSTTRPLAPIESWYNRETGKTTYKQVIR